MPKDHRFAVEIRDKNGLVAQFVEALRERSITLALVDQAWMPRPAKWFEKFDPITAYVGWLGDRKWIEERTKVWNEIIVATARANKLIRMAYLVQERGRAVIHHGSESLTPLKAAHIGANQQTNVSVRTWPY